MDDFTVDDYAGPSAAKRSSYVSSAPAPLGAAYVPPPALAPPPAVAGPAGHVVLVDLERRNAELQTEVRAKGERSSVLGFKLMGRISEMSEIHNKY